MKNKQGITIAALIVAIIGLSVGFAAFSNTLSISSSASVNPDDSTLNVVWSSSSSSAATDSISPTKDPNNITNFTATNGSITGNDYRTLNNLSASFTAPGQSVTYSLYVYNAGQLQAQLTGITFNNATNATGGETYKHCYAKTDNVPAAQQATDSLVSAACEGISISVSIGTATGVTPQTTGDKAALNYQLINKNSALEATVTITYASGSSYVDGPMEVEFGDITINATSAVDPTRVVAASSPSTPDYTSQFLSVEQGVLSRYLGDSTTPVIPDDLRLPVTTLTYTYNNTKCVQNATMLGADEGEEQAFCNEYVKPQFGEEGITPRSYQWLYENSGSEFFGVVAYYTDETRTTSAQSYPITTISDGAFSDDITSITIGDGITTIEVSAFEEFDVLATITIGSGITNIGSNAFRHIASSPSITIDRNSTDNISIGGSAFDSGVTIHYNDTDVVYGS